MNDPHKFNPKSKGFKEITWIPIRNLSVVWAQSQRKLKEKHAQDIADNFDPEMFGLLAVTRPNGHGMYHVIDGHHRRVAVEKLWGEDEMVPCQVFDAEDPARAAKLFDEINTRRKSPQPIEIFRVRVTAGNKVQVSINKIVQSCGYIISSHGGKTKHDVPTISCVGALEAVYMTSGGDVLKETLDTINAVWGIDTGAVGAVMVRGIGEFLSEFRDFDRVRLRERMANSTPARLLGRAKQWQEIHGGGAASAVKRIMIELYNDGLRTEKKRLRPTIKE